VVWAGFLAALAIWPDVRERGSVELRALARLFVPYLLPVVAFLAFWAWNGSISLSHVQAGAHPAMTFHLANVILALIVAGLLLPLQSLIGLHDFAAASRARRWLLAMPLLVFAAVYFGFHADNPYNTAFPDFYLHNGLVQAISAQAGWRALAAAVATLAACGLALTRLRPAAAFWLYPISAFALAAEWLVETRYLIVPFALWLAFREQRSKSVEYATLALWAALAVWIIAGTLNGRLFP
jgi:alpha-1,2-glucosyltransferase